MQRKTQAIIVAVVFTAVGFLLQSNAPIGAMIWPPNAENPEPTGAQLPLLMTLGVVSAIAFGLSIAFLAYGWPAVRARFPESKGLAVAVFLSVFWFLFNWVPHESLHIANGMDLGGLIAIEYGFHVTLIAAGAIIAYALVKVGAPALGEEGPPAHV